LSLASPDRVVARRREDRADRGRVEDRLLRAGTVAGPAGVAVSLGSILVATTLTPAFSWTGSALSDLGAPGAPYAAVFNGGTVLGGVLGAVFVARVGVALSRAGLPTREPGRVGRDGDAGRAGAPVGVAAGPDPVATVAAWGGLLALAVATLALVGVGLFPVGDPRHGPVSVAFFVALAYGLLLVGTGQALAGAVRRGLATAWLGVVAASAWLVYALVAAGGAEPGVALPELVGALALGTWVVLTARTLAGTG
jgi:hypothetical membrane protein